MSSIASPSGNDALLGLVVVWGEVLRGVVVVVVAAVEFGADVVGGTVTVLDPLEVVVVDSSVITVTDSGVVITVVEAVLVVLVGFVILVLVGLAAAGGDGLGAGAGTGAGGLDGTGAGVGVVATLGLPGRADAGVTVAAILVFVAGVVPAACLAICVSASSIDARSESDFASNSATCRSAAIIPDATRFTSFWAATNAA